MSVFVVTIEWERPSSEVTGDPGICGVFLTRSAADLDAYAERKSYDEAGETVANYSMVEGRYCGNCGEQIKYSPVTKVCQCSGAGEESFCDCCGAELNDNGECDNDHDEWTIDIHVTECEVRGIGPADTLGPPVNWADTRAQASGFVIDSIREDAANKAQHYARIAAYFRDTARRAHTPAVRHANRVVRQLREALGFAYTKANDLDF